MEATVKSLGIDRLSLAERLLLVEEIWDSIAEEEEGLEIPQSHKEELDLYRIDGDEAIVLGVIHMRRRPRNWRSRS